MIPFIVQFKKQTVRRFGIKALPPDPKQVFFSHDTF